MRTTLTVATHIINHAPRYLTDLCIPVSSISARQNLRSATWHLYVVPRCQLSTLGPRAYSVAGSSLWNSLPDSLRDPDLGSDSVRRHMLKTHLFTLYSSIYHIRDVSGRYALQSHLVTYLPTYYSASWLILNFPSHVGWKAELNPSQCLIG